MDLLRILIAILLPPLGVFLQVGIGKHFWINILLTLLGYIPGIVHAVWVIAKNSCKKFAAMKDRAQNAPGISLIRYGG